MTDGDSVTINNLRNSANGTFVTLDDYLTLTVVERLDGLARITSKELATAHSVKGGTLQNACSTRPRVVVGLVKSARMHIRQVDEQPTKRSKKHDDKSAVAMLMEGDLHESVRALVDNYVKGHDRSGRPDEKT